MHRQKDCRTLAVDLFRLSIFWRLATSRVSQELRVVEFHRLHSLPIDYLRQRAIRSLRLRLMPPYREHLSQAFARYFMRVGLPLDIPAFTR